MNIVITTINAPTEAVMKFSGMEGVSRLILVGDKKTPDIQSNGLMSYYGITDQNDLFPKLSRSLPCNHYCRKILGYLIAARGGGDYIYDTDDDNIPYDTWTLPDLSKINSLIKSSDDWVNIYQLFTEKKVWPRGLPLTYIGESRNYEIEKLQGVVNIAVIQGLADDEPDVDAIYRLVIGERIRFDPDLIYAIDRYVYSPFNSQNTYWKSSFLPLMYLPVTVTFRFTDILRGYIAQRLIWEKDAYIAFCSPTVYQDRNAHDLMTDFKDEIPMYERCNEVVNALNALTLSGHLSDDILKAYQALVRIGVCSKSELETLTYWLEVCSELGKEDS